MALSFPGKSLGSRWSTTRVLLRRLPKVPPFTPVINEFTLISSHLALEEARKTVKVHEDKVEALEQTLFELRGKIGAGNHVPPGMRVLCLRDNPAQQWSDLRQSVMDRLKSENEALMKRLRDLESSGVVDAQVGTSRGEELVPRESWEVLHKEKEELEEIVKQKEKRLLRLQQVCGFTFHSWSFNTRSAGLCGQKY